MEGVCHLGQASVGSWGWAIELTGASHVEGLVGSFSVEFDEEVIEAGLLLKAVHARRPGGFLLQGEMHALMAPVLLRVARLDALDGDAEPEPPDGEL